MNVHQFLKQIEQDGKAVYSISEGVLNPEDGFIFCIPDTFEKFDGSYDSLQNYVMKHIKELASPQRYILASRINIEVGIKMSESSARELASINGGDWVYNCQDKKYELTKS